MMLSRSVKKQISDKVKKNAEARQRMSRNLIVRVTDDLYGKLEDMAATLSAEMPGRRTTVSDVARAVLEFGLRKRSSDFLYSRPGTEPEEGKEGI